MVEDSRAAARAHRLRPLNLPVPVAVTMRGDGLPEVVTVDGAQRAVLAVRERWRVDDEWWRRPISRDYVEVVLDDGRRLVLFRDLLTGEWFRQRA